MGLDFKVDTAPVSDTLFDHLFACRGHKANKINT
jgi:hypothetical protein